MQLEEQPFALHNKLYQLSYQQTAYQDVHLKTTGCKTERDRSILTLQRPLRNLAGWIVAAALVFAPFALGCIPPWAIAETVFALSVATGLWLLDRIFWFRSASTRLPKVAVVCSCLLLCAGWFMTVNATRIFDPFHNALVPIAHPFAHLPGAFEQITAKLAMIRLDALVGALLIACDLGAEEKWRMRWLHAIAWTGAAIAALGISEQAGLVTFLASRMSQTEGAHFATYNYHGNAGAYMNLSLAISGGLLLQALSEKDQTKLGAWRRRGNSVLLAITVAGVLFNTSRGAQLISLLEILALGCFAVTSFAHHKAVQARTKRYAVPLVAVLCVLLLAALVGQSHRNLNKWLNIAGAVSSDASRWQVWHVTKPMVRSAGLLGHGPGAFKMMLPISKDLSNALYSRWIIQEHIPGERTSMWSMAHNDYLQTIVEYGWLGFLLLAVILGGGLLTVAWRQWVRDYAPKLPGNASLFGVVIGLGGVLLHSGFDFPLQVASIQLTAVVFTGICWSASRW